MTVGILLAAGLGSRLRPLTDDRPKCLMDLGGETLLARLVRQLVAGGVTHLVVATGYEAARVEEALARAPVPVTFAPCPDYATTQNSVSLLRALDRCPPGAVVKLDGDLVVPDAVITLALSAAGSCVLVDDRAPPREEAMKVRCDGDRAVAFGKGLDPARCRGESIGIERFTPADRAVLHDVLRETVARGVTDRYYEDLYDDAIRRGVTLHARSLQGAAWTEVDDHTDLARARALVREGL
ncbi:MAG: phosphocholine cytidylyltransferase family protein [Polyangiales bacterium]